MVIMLSYVKQLVLLIISFHSLCRVHNFELIDNVVHDEGFGNGPVNICNMSLSAETMDSKPTKCACDLLMKVIDCSDLKIRQLPSLISFPKTVQVANFRSNKITDINDDTFYSGKEIVELDLSNNRINFLSIDSFTAFHNVRHLILSHNALWTLQPSVFEPLSSIRSLDLSFNDLRYLQPDIFKQLGMLKDLKLSSNPLHKLEPEIFEHMPRLEILDLSSTLLEGIPENVFATVPNLRMLSLANNRLATIPTAALKTLKKLKMLDLSGNGGFKIIGARSFEGLHALSILYLDRMQNLEAIDALAFGDLKLLTELHCSYNEKLCQIHEDAFLNMETGKKVELNQLFLRQNYIETLPVKLQSWNEFTELDLRNNPWNCDCRSLWLLHLETKTPFKDNVRCAKPSKLEGRTLGELEGSQLICSEISRNEIIIISCAITIAVLLLFLIVLIVIHKRNFKYDKSYFHIFSDKNDIDQEYPL